MEQQKYYQIEFYIGLADSEEVWMSYPLKEAVDKITELIGDCTIIPCIGSYRHESGIRVNMNSLQVIKFINYSPEEFVLKSTNEFKKCFNQKCIITNITECYNLQFN